MQVLFRLFRHRENAFKAEKLLREQGLETGLLGKGIEEDEIKELTIPEIGHLYVRGLLAQLSETDPLKSLQDLLGIPPDTLDYYRFGLSTNAVLLAVRCPQEQEIAHLLKTLPDISSPPISGGFSSAGRMTETNPLDEKMTGEFRRY